MKVTSSVTVIAVAFLLVACAADRDQDRVKSTAQKLLWMLFGDDMPITLRMSDADNKPIANARLICHDNSSFLGTTDSDGC